MIHLQIFQKVQWSRLRESTLFLLGSNAFLPGSRAFLLGSNKRTFLIGSQIWSIGAQLKTLQEHMTIVGPTNVPN
jgi:hypothetical protein